MDWHQMTIEQVIAQLETTADGLCNKEAAAHHKNMANTLQEKKARLLLIFRQFVDVMIFVLIVAAVVSGFVGETSRILL